MGRDVETDEDDWTSLFNEAVYSKYHSISDSVLFLFLFYIWSAFICFTERLRLLNWKARWDRLDCSEKDSEILKSNKKGNMMQRSRKEDSAVSFAGLDSEP